jgi:hypothetical protein
MKLFNWINPLWVIDTFFTMRLEPITATSALGAMLGAGGTAAANAALTGAGIGALGGAATGRDPLKSALIGGALGGGGSLLGAGGASAGAAKSASNGSLLSTASAEPLAGGGVGNLGMFTNPQATSVMGGVGDVSGLGLSGTYAQAAPMYTGSQGMFDVAQGSTLGGQGAATFAGGGGYNPSLFGRISESIGNPFIDLTSRDKLGLGLQGASMLSQPQQMIQPSQGQISRPQFDPSSTLVNVAPNVNPQDKPLTEEELLRLKQLAQYGYRG